MKMLRTTVKSRLLAACTIFAIAGTLSACSPRVYSGGNKVLAEKLERIKPGEVSKSQVKNILGNPSSQSLYGQSTWFYISDTRETFAFYKPEETERQVVAISFDPQNMVERVAEYGLKDGKQVIVSEKKTPTAGHDYNFLEQMMGNIGRFNADE